MTVLRQALLEYGAAIRGDWSDIDGRSVQGQMEEFASAAHGGPEASWTIEKWRAEMGVCPDGGGHWASRYYGYCETDDGCPSLRNEESA